jgi:hypothetical protein
MPSVFTDVPTDDSTEPLDIPAVSWWWGLLAEDARPVRTPVPAHRSA